MRTTPAHHRNVFDFDSSPSWQGIHASTGCRVPSAPRALAEKRAILASWASDASAIASCPALRAPDGLKAPVHIDEILQALCALDDNGPRHPPGGKPMRLRSIERRAAA